MRKKFKSFVHYVTFNPTQNKCDVLSKNKNSFPPAMQTNDLGKASRLMEEKTQMTNDAGTDQLPLMTYYNIIHICT